ncbi:MAG: hypothetical protein LQ338_003282 [Usnochroma carphineum]|nr:MAG: hypothetical protein LQ338_003282 [Usnochroma carphineum]
MTSSTLADCLSHKVDSTAIIIPKESNPIVISHRELRRRVFNFQKKLASIGITHRDAVAIALPNSLEFSVAFLAATSQRAIAAPLNPAYKQGEFEFYLSDLKAAVVLVPKGAIAENSEAVKAARACKTPVAEIAWDWLEITLAVEKSQDVTTRMMAPINSAAPEDIALVLHTSGTTGRPKAVGESAQVPLTHKNLCRTMTNIQNTYKLTSSDRTLLVMPLFHVHGLLAGFLSPLVSGGSIIVPPCFSGSDFWRDFVAFKANWFTAVPTIHQILLKKELPSPMPTIRFVRSCSSPLSPTVHQRLETALDAPVIEAYAMTEAAHQMTSNPLPPATRKPGSVGIAQGVNLEITDEAGKPLRRGEIGEVCVKGENVTSGYLGDPGVVASPFTPVGFLRTGDQGYVDQDGYVFLTGRIKELINKGGEKISPIEIDNALVQHPQVQEAVSFAVEDEIYGQDVGVAVVLVEGALLSTPELLAWFSERAARFKVPKKVFYLTEMPKTATGKVQRRLVAQAILARGPQSEHQPRQQPEALCATTHTPRSNCGAEKKPIVTSIQTSTIGSSVDEKETVAGSETGSPRSAGLRGALVRLLCRWG